MKSKNAWTADVQPLPVVGGGAQCLLHAGDQVLDVPTQHRQIQLQLARKVLVQNGFADSRAVGDLVHAGRVVAAVDEDVAGDDEQLAATLVAGQPVAAPVLRSLCRRRPTAVSRFDGTPCAALARSLIESSSDRGD